MEYLEAAEKKALLAARKNLNFYGTFEILHVIQTTVDAEKLILDENIPNNTGQFCEKIRDQFRLRIHVYGMLMPKIGGGSSPPECERLIKEFLDIVKLPLPAKLSTPSPFPVRPEHSSPTAEAVMLSVKYNTQAAAMLSVILASANGGVVLSLARQHRMRREVLPEHVAIQGVQFVESNIDWKVLEVKYDKEYKQLVVWYYDVKIASDQGLSEADYLEAIRTGVECEGLVLSSLQEVVEWIEASQEADQMEVGITGLEEPDIDVQEEAEEEGIYEAFSDDDEEEEVNAALFGLDVIDDDDDDDGEDDDF